MYELILTCFLYNASFVLRGKLLTGDLSVCVISRLEKIPTVIIVKSVKMTLYTARSIDKMVISRVSRLMGKVDA